MTGKKIKQDSQAMPFGIEIQQGKGRISIQFAKKKQRNKVWEQIDKHCLNIECSSHATQHRRVRRVARA